MVSKIVTHKAHAPLPDVPESTERQADIAMLEQEYEFRISEMRQHQLRIRCLNAYGEINTRK